MIGLAARVGSQMRPVFALPDPENCGLRNSKLLGQLRCRPRVSEYFQNLRFRQFCRTVTSSPINRPVTPFVGVVLFRRFPRQMLPIAASEMPLAATMRRMVFWCWRRAVLAFAHLAVDHPALAVAPDLSISIAGRPIRPNQALVAVEGKNGVFQKGSPLAGRGSSAERVPVFTKSFIVISAPHPGANRLAAAINSAYSRISHVVSSYVRGQGRAALQRCFRPVSYGRITVCSQGAGSWE